MKCLKTYQILLIILAQTVCSVFVSQARSATPLSTVLYQDGFTQDSESLLPNFRRMAAQRVFMVAAQTHAHDGHAGVGNGLAQRGSLTGRPIQAGQPALALVNGNLDEVIAGPSGFF